MRQLESEMHFVKNYRRCFAGKPLVASSNVHCFLGLLKYVSVKMSSGNKKTMSL